MARRTFLVVLALPILAACSDRGGMAAGEEPPFSGMYPLLENGRLGFMDASGKVVIQPQFVTAFSDLLDGDRFSENLAPLPTGSKWGYINQTGQYVINPQFDEARPFREGLAAVRVDDRFGFIDRTGTYVINPQFSEVGEFSEGLAPFRMGEKWGYVDRTGTYVVNPQFDYASTFTGALAAVLQNERWGYVDAKGKFVINPQFEMAYPFYGRQAVVAVSGSDDGPQFGVIDRTGKYVVNPQFQAAGERYRDGLLRVLMGGKTGFVDEKGAIVINPQFDEAGDFMGGLAPVRIDERWGFINTSGTYVIPLQFDHAEPFAEGLARVRVGGRYGFANAQGTLVIRPQFLDAGSRFRNGRVWVATERGMGYVDAAGQFVRQPTPVARVTSLDQLDSLFATLPASFHEPLVADLRGREREVVQAAGGMAQGAQYLNARGDSVSGTLPVGGGAFFAVLLAPGQSYSGFLYSPEFDTELRVHRLANGGASTLVATNDDYQGLNSSRVNVQPSELSVHVFEVMSYQESYGGRFSFYVGPPEQIDRTATRVLSEPSVQEATAMDTTTVAPATQTAPVITQPRP
jgi:hypothetical protein